MGSLAHVDYPVHKCANPIGGEEVKRHRTSTQSHVDSSKTSGEGPTTTRRLSRAFILLF